MGETRVEIVGLDQFQRAAGRVDDACAKAADDAAWATANELAVTVRSITPVVSGRLRGSTVATKVEGGAGVVFGEGVPYAGWIEFGGTRGRPYVPEGRYLGSEADTAGHDYVETTKKNVDREIGSLPWPK